MAKKILIVDDEKEILELIQLYLEKEGHKVLKAQNGIEAWNKILESDVDLAIIDIMLPGLDGYQLTKKIRERYTMPIIIVSAKNEDNDKILGIITGADDYIAKPFNPLELVVRVKAQLRRYLRTTILPKNDEIVIDDLVINSNTHQVTVGENEIKFTSKEFEILKLLAENKNVVFSSRKIYESVWNEEFYESDSTIMTHIKNIREKLGENVKNPKYIKTVWGVGYKIEG